ncbi:Nuclease-related domain-containing protein [Parafrankia irregularis]|uniref:Nuclease-related domain-containing protein n=1 Tax=Parafrankia irregularis TaxID=795642 RepID=A0A0S4QQD9_9ACTN|nr:MULTISPECIES: nuclease-related domain-containing protein [Parafrankia]MBE3204505.1 NERD domain-containing protein [Parafrankia sp. CH37]CUU57783.1 Nuclease-related domain-containing protein [Parafrankia irregularis]
MVRRDRIARDVPRAAIRAAIVGLGLGLVIGFGLGLPSLGVTVFVALLVIWPGGMALAAFGASPDVETLREAAEAERKTAHAISRLRRRGYVILHDRAVPYSEATIGHLLVGPGGVMILGSDTNKGVVRYTKGGAVVDGESLKPAIDKTAWLGGEVRNQIRAALPMLKFPTYPILVMVEASVLWKDGALEGVTVLNVKDVVDYIRHKPGRLNPGQVQQVVAAAQRLFPPYSSNRLAEEIVVDRDQWLTLMDALRTIQENGGDASGMLDRLAQIEADLGRQADLVERRGLRRARSGSDEPTAGFGTGATTDSVVPPGSTGSGLAPLAPNAPAVRPGARRGRRILASVQPERAGDSKAAQGRPLLSKGGAAGPAQAGTDQQASPGALDGGDSTDGLPGEPGARP